MADHLEALEQYRGAAADLLAGATAAMEAAYAMTRRGGAVVVAGLPDPQQKFVIPPVAAFVADERAVVGSYMGSCVPQRDVPRFMGTLPARTPAGESPTFRHRHPRHH